MGRFTLRLVAVLVLIALLAACGGGDDGDKKSAKGEPMDSLSSTQLVGQWMDSDGNVIEFNRDGSISGYSDYNFEAATYTVANSDGESLLLLNTTNGSVYAREFTLTQIMGCDGHAFAFVVDDGSNYPEVWWFIGGADSDPVTASELRAHPWRVNAQTGAEIEFKNGGKAEARSLGFESEGIWSLENNELTTALSEGQAEDVSIISRVARCNGSPMIVVLQNLGGGSSSFLSDPSVTPNTAE